MPLRPVTVVVACRNERARIDGFLTSLSSLDCSGLEFEAVVADGASADGTRGILDRFARQHGWLRVIDNPGLIASTGLNAAIEAARGEFILRMDAHTVYEPEYVKRCLEVLDATGAWNVGGPQRSKAAGYVAQGIEAGYHTPFASGGARFRNDSYCGVVDTVPYGCWRRATLFQVGLFDETLVRNQDDELNMRIRAAGGTVWQDPSIVSWYTPRSSFSALLKQYFQFGFWRVAVMRKHPASVALRHYVPAAALLTGVALLIATALGSPLAGRSFGMLAVAYAVMSVLASFQAASRFGWRLLPILPRVFAFYQGGYAAGFIAGLVYWGLCRQPRKQVPRVFTSLTR